MDTGVFKLSSKNPIISPLDLPFQAAAVLNSRTVVALDCSHDLVIRA